MIAELSSRGTQEDMSKINQIQRALNELDGGVFQKLADSYLHKKGYENINSIGSVLGEDKVRKGTPDSYFRQENGKIIFAEYTTLKGNTVEKLKSDLEKCLDTAKTGVSLKEIEEIVFCHNSQLDLSDEQELYDEGKNNGIKIQIFGIQGISFDLYQKYPSLARDFLGVTVDTGQILDPEEFVAEADKNQISTPLDTKFHGRKEELENVITKIEGCELLVLSGSAGIGKSRLAIEALQEYRGRNSSIDLRVIHNKGMDVFEDLRSYFSAPGDFLILVDDANRITQFDYVIDLIQNQRSDQNIKVVATVRDYAKDKVRDAARPLASVSEVELHAMDSKQIKTFVQEQFDIRNPIYLDRIANIAGGNPRLAVMAASLAVKENSLESIRDVSSLYDEYYASISSDLKKLENINVLKVAGLISFFRYIDKSNIDFMRSINRAFDLSPDIFWGGVRYLHSAEIVDVYEEEVVKISDQVFATYLFYLCFLKDRVLQFSCLLDNYFPSHVDQLRDALYPCFNSFDFNFIAGITRNNVSKKWDEYSDKGNAEELIQLIKTFWFLTESRVLLYLRDNISEMPERPFDIASTSFETKNISLNSKPLLDILARFSQASNENTFRSALDLCCMYVKKDPCSAPEFIKVMIENYGFSRRSHQSDYLLQSIVISSLWEKTKEGEDELFSRLFIEVSSNFLKTQFDEHEGGRHSITIHKFRLLATESIFHLRENIWRGLFKLYKNIAFKGHVYTLISNYCSSGYDLSNKDIVEKDAVYLVPFMESTFNPECFSECLLVQKYSKLLRSRDIDLAVKASEYFLSDVYELYALMAFDYSDIEVSNIQEFNSIKRQKILTYIESFSVDDFKNIFCQIKEIISFLDGRHEIYQIKNAVHTVFECIAGGDSRVYETVLQNYLNDGNELDIYQPSVIVTKLLELCDPQRAFELLRVSDYTYKKHWLFGLYACLHESHITPKEAGELLELYESADPYEIPY